MPVLGRHPGRRRAATVAVLALLFPLLALTPARGAPPATWASVFTGAGQATCAIRSDGTLWCWGGNPYGTIVRDPGEHRATPVRVNESRAWASASPGRSHTCAIRTGGSLWCWGANDSGQLGLGRDHAETFRPARVGTASDWASVTAADRATCAIRTDRSLWCWGGNSDHRVGDGTGTDRWAPTRIGTGTWSAVELGATHGCGIRTDGTLWCWGSGPRGELGLGAGRTVVKSPVQVGTATSWVSLNSTANHQCAVDTGHGLWCWGANAAGQLGDGTTAGRHVPVRVGAGTSWASVAAGLSHTCALTTDGRTYCWGANDTGELGDGTITGASRPTAVNTDLTTRSIIAGWGHTCALTAGRDLWCWGSNFGGSLGDGTEVSSPNTPSAVPVGAATDWAGLALGGRHTCALRAGATLWCWGDNTDGQLGDGRTVSRPAPARVAGGGAWAEVAAGEDATCGIRPDGTLWCWGDVPAEGNAARPRQVGDLGGWVDVSVGDNHVCGVRADAGLWCWGANDHGQVAAKPSASPLPPARVRTDVAAWAEVAAGQGHTCARTSEGRLWCWGEDVSPGGPAGLSGVTTVRAHAAGFCALGTDHRLWCWEYHTDPDRAVPRLVSGDRTWTAVGVSGPTGCGIRNDASLWCWGDNFEGQLGDGTVAYREGLVRPGTASWLTVSLGGRHTCGIRADHSLWCWGNNGNGQLGRLQVARRAIPAS
jgi:alpha-tubulin suppressor-like RCC1 family protein